MNKKDLAEKILEYVIQEFKDRALLDLKVFEQEFGVKSFDEVAETISGFWI
ncbi:hypothetical protein ES703_119701 [subsurface metagenome]